MVQCVGDGSGKEAAGPLCHTVAIYRIRPHYFYCTGKAGLEARFPLCYMSIASRFNVQSFM